MKNNGRLRAATLKYFLLPALLCLALSACVTAPPAAPVPPDPAMLEALFAEGIELQDKGDARGAIKVFDRILELEPRHVPALSEKSYALMVLHRYRPVIDLTTQVLKDHAGSNQLLFIYINRGNAFAYLNQPAEALKVFDEGLAAFPNANLLYFNKGLTLAEQGRKDEAEWNFQKAIVEAPDEPSAHLALGHLTLSKGEYIPALMAFSRFLIVEPEGRRAKSSLKELKKLMAHITTANLPASPDTATAGSAGFRTTELALQAAVAKKAAATAQPAKKKSAPRKGQAPATAAGPEPEIRKFRNQFALLCNALRQHEPHGTGFYWTFYTPYFIEMQDLTLLQPFARVAFVSDDIAENDAWLKENKNELGRFFAWSEIYPWNKTLPPAPPVGPAKK